MITRVYEHEKYSSNNEPTRVLAIVVVVVVVVVVVPTCHQRTTLAVNGKA